MTPPTAKTPQQTPPLSLYIHLPWCVKKCPYCDFNSYGLRGEPDYALYADCLLADLDGDLADMPELATRPIVSIFFGGGTPSLFPPRLIARILAGVRARLTLAEDCETTLETNPGTVEHGRFEGYREAGVNRLSLGAQSFDDTLLKRLGRIHCASETEAAVAEARAAGFDNFNLDLMYALPGQTLAGALADVQRALTLAPTHVSHYQLTLEPNTAFAARPPAGIPEGDLAWDIQLACQQALATAGYRQYEVSAYAQPGRRCRHNINYWRYGDYLGIGAGAHGKLSNTAQGPVLRRWKRRLPQAWMQAPDHATRIGASEPVAPAERPFEYMLNALRLMDGVPLAEFAQRTGLSLADIEQPLAEARRRGWLQDDAARLQTTETGQRFLNDVITLFMD